MNEILALGGVGLAGASGVLAALIGLRTRTGDRLFVCLMLLGAALGMASALGAILGFGASSWKHWGGDPAIEVDALSGMFLAQIYLIGGLGAIYGLGYWSAEQYSDSAGRLRIFYGLMVAGMALLVIARNSILFLIGWEVMAIAAFFSLSIEDRKPGVRDVGFVYLVATRIGTLLVMACFAVLRFSTGSFSLSVTGLDGGTSGASAIFFLALLGFGLKAGLMPLHVWLPAAHATAPSHVSALMSGVLIKMGVYGLLRCSSWFETVPVWWGVLMFSGGMVSALLGVAFAIGQHDLKRLLAYHSVENIGIIVSGFGIALLGRATGHFALVLLGLGGALLHTWNHGLFKALLFLSAGSVIRATETRQIDLLGGLAKKLPRTCLAFFVGAIAISGLPPLNGFASELLVYLGMLRAGSLEIGTIGIAAALGVPVLALVGGLAALCFAKVFGVVFLGTPRSEHGSHAIESPWSMIAPMAVLGICCLILGAAPLLVAPVLERATSAWLGAATPYPLSALAPLGPIAWVNTVLILGVIGMSFLFFRTGPARATYGPTWDCGYAAGSARMQYTASSFSGWILDSFRSVLRPRVEAPELSGPFPGPSRFRSHVPEVVLDLGILPAGRALARIAVWFRWIQKGSVHLYLLYILGALISMLFIWR